VNIALLLFTIAADAGLKADLIFPRHSQHNHSSCIVECPNGDLLACWYRGSGERSADDVAIFGARKAKNADQWSEPFLLADTPDFPDCNPILHVDAKQRLWLFWPTILDNHWESALLKAKRSDHYLSQGPPKWNWRSVVHLKPQGLEAKMLGAFDSVPKALFELRPRWKEEVETWRRRAGDKLYQRLGWMPRVHAVNLPTGEILLPLYCDTFSIGLTATTTDGESWKTGGAIVGFGGVQPSVAQRKNGELVAFLRNNGWGGRIPSATSMDGGANWSSPVLTDIPNSGSSVEAIVLKSGAWLLVANDLARGRHRLSAFLSEDEGRTWTRRRILEDLPPGKGAASYPSVLQAGDGGIHVTYTFNDLQPGKTIKHVWFSEPWLKAGEGKSDTSP
jgi:predicted neuraminidase